jgi:GAF domain-containing protein
MKKVDKETVCIIEDLKTLRQNPESLLELGWSDNEVATQDINSWIGLAAKSHGKTIAFITLDHKEPKHYKSSDHQFIEFLKDVGEIFADTIQDFFLRRNRDTLQKIISNVGESLSCEDLVDKILEILKESLQCDSCKYFYISNDPESENRESFLEEKSSTHKFKKGMGIVGAAWESGESLIIPHAFEDNRFLARPNFQGDNVSMLAVPVIPVFDNINNAPRRTIGVICCHKKKIDYFTVYDRDLVDEVVRITATIIERTRILGFFDKISSKMLERVGDSMQVKRLLQDICEYALRVTNAGSASIHLLKYISNDGQASIKGYTLDRDKYNNPIYYTFPPEKEESPRLNGEGVTDYLIQELTSIEKSIEFSIDDDTMFNKINKKQRDEGVQYKLLVPLLVNRKGEQCSLIGVLYLNKYVHEPFSSVEKFAVELFANQAATIIDNKRIIEDQKSTSESNNKLFEQIQSSNKILAGLYRSLAKIVVESPQEMLSRAVTQTRESLNAKEVIVILINEKDNTTSIVPDSPVNERINISLKEKSIKVYEDNQKGRCNNTKELLWQEFPEIERNGLYILFTAGSHCLGVMWILFTGGIPPQNYIDDHTEIYKLYANQIALAYDNAKQFESLKNKSKDELHKQISLDYKNARRSSNWFFYVSLASSIVGLFLIFGGANKLLASPENGAVNDQNAQNAISVGALLQAVTVLAFQQSKSANDRVDQYHKELYNTGKLSILLSATEQLEPDLVQQEKKQIIQATTQSWMHHDIKETSEN